MNAAVEEAHELNVSRTFRASRERVFAAWTEPEQVKKWFGSDTCRISEIQADVRSGGTYRMSTVSGKELSGEYREVTPPSKLVYTWQWANDPDFADRTTLVTVEFLATGDSTEVRLRHENLPSVESRDGHQLGWTSCLENLETWLS